MDFILFWNYSSMEQNFQSSVPVELKWPKCYVSEHCMEDLL